MGVKFNIPFTLVNRSLFTADPNIFRTANKVVTSIDFISREDILSVVSNTSWDMVILMRPINYQHTNTDKNIQIQTL